MCDEDVAALVVDNGSGMFKAGFAGVMLTLKYPAEQQGGDDPDHV